MARHLVPFLVVHYLFAHSHGQGVWKLVGLDCSPLITFCFFQECIFLGPLTLNKLSNVFLLLKMFVKYTLLLIQEVRVSLVTGAGRVGVLAVPNATRMASH